MIDAIASDRAGEEEAEERIEVPVDIRRARGGGTDGDERDLTEADLTGPPGEDHERHRDDRVDGHRGGQGSCLSRSGGTAT